LIQPYKGKIYDPACGSGGMFVQSIKFVEQNNGSTKDVSVYGQEKNDQTLKLAKMNLAIRGITADFGEEAASTFTKDQHKNLKADFIMANPPFNQSSWRAADELVDDERWNGYDVPPEGNANYGWILNIVSKLSRDGVAGFLLANGSLNGGGVEHSIRSKLIENHLVDAILYLPRNLFYTTDIGVSLWIIANNKKARMSEIDGKPTELRDRENEILFVDLRQWGSPFEKKYIEFTDEDISKVEKTYHDWESVNGFSQYKDVPEYCKSVSLETIRSKDYTLVPSEYIEFINNDENVDYDAKMKELQEQLQILLKEDQQATEKLVEVMKELGYEIKL
jgi:type I restriction enzyme M protein